MNQEKESLNKNETSFPVIFCFFHRYYLFYPGIVCYPNLLFIFHPNIPEHNLFKEGPIYFWEYVSNLILMVKAQLIYHSLKYLKSEDAAYSHTKKQKTGHSSHTAPGIRAPKVASIFYQCPISHG